MLRTSAADSSTSGIGSTRSTSSSRRSTSYALPGNPRLARMSLPAGVRIGSAVAVIGLPSLPALSVDQAGLGIAVVLPIASASSRSRTQTDDHVLRPASRRDPCASAGRVNVSCVESNDRPLMSKGGSSGRSHRDVVQGHPVTRRPWEVAPTRERSGSMSRLRKPAASPTAVRFAPTSTSAPILRVSTRRSTSLSDR
jgi:hypothetical protein